MPPVNVTEFISGARFNRFHVGMLFWACLVIVFDMYDLVAFGSVLPSLLEDWQITAVEAGAIGSTGPIGMMIGAIVLGSLADRLGRRNILTLSVAVFSLASVLCGVVADPTLFAALRFIAGLGIGGLMPTVIAMVTDYAPRGRGSTLVGIVTCAISVGGILAPLVSMNLIPTFGWQSVYWVAGIPLVLLPFMVRFWPDSPAALLSRGRADTLRAVLRQVNPDAELPQDAELVVVEQDRQAGAPIRELFRHGRGFATLAIWIAFFMCLLMVNGLSTWLPNLMVQSGYALNSSLSFSISLNVGAIIGTLILGRVADAWGVKRVLVPMFVVAAVALFLLGYGEGTVLLMLLAALTGATTMGAQNISYAFASQYYPSFMRSTAIGLASGVGRIGAIFGPTLGGLILGSGLPVEAAFLGFAVPGILAAVAFLVVPLGKGTGGTRGAARDARSADALAPADRQAPERTMTSG